MEEIVSQTFQKKFKRIGRECSVRESLGSKVVLQLLREVFTGSPPGIEFDDPFRSFLFDVGDDRKDMGNQRDHLACFILLSFLLVFCEVQLVTDSSDVSRTGHLIADFPIKGVCAGVSVIFLRECKVFCVNS